MFSPLRGEVHYAVCEELSDEFRWGRCLEKIGCTRDIPFKASKWLAFTREGRIRLGWLFPFRWIGELFWE